MKSSIASFCIDLLSSRHKFYIYYIDARARYWTFCSIPSYLISPVSVPLYAKILVVAVDLANAIRSYIWNYWRFGFQAIRIWSLITIQIRFQGQFRVNHCNYDQILIYFWKKIVQFRLNSTNYWLKDRLKDLKKSIKWSKVLI